MAEERVRVLARLDKALAARLDAEVERTGGLAKNRIVVLALDRYLPPLPKGWKKRKM